MSPAGLSLEFLLIMITVHLTFQMGSETCQGQQPKGAGVLVLGLIKGTWGIPVSLLDFLKSYHNFRNVYIQLIMNLGLKSYLTK